MEKVLFLTREDEKILSFGIEQSYKRIEKRGLNNFQASSGSLICETRYRHTNVDNLKKSVINEFLINQSPSASLDRDVYYDLHHIDSVTRFDVPKYNTKESMDLIEIFGNIVKSKYDNEQFIIRLDSISYKETNVEKYIRLASQLQNINEEDRIKIILDTEFHKRVFDIAKFLKELNTTSLNVYTVDELYAAANMLRDISDSKMICVDSFIDIAEVNNEKMKTLGKALSLTYPNAWDKFTTAGFNSKTK